MPLAVLALAGFVGLGAVGRTAGAPRGSAAPATSAVSAAVAASGEDDLLAYLQAGGRLRAALAAHDGLLVAHFRADIARLMTPSLITALTAYHGHLGRELATAVANHDPRMRAEFAAQIAALCPRAPAASALGFCR
jgi:bisphosphoglycerate-independent phosphoglycerate mutase (AlkP superfamily)